jgi:hypothetical protein
MIWEGCGMWLWHIYILYCVFQEELSKTTKNSSLGNQFSWLQNTCIGPLCGLLYMLWIFQTIWNCTINKRWNYKDLKAVMAWSRYNSSICLEVLRTR